MYSIADNKLELKTGASNTPVVGEVNYKKRNNRILIDWLTVVFKDKLLKDVVKLYGATGLERCDPFNHYDNAVKDNRGIKYLWHSTRSDMGICVVVTGDTGQTTEPGVLWASNFGRISRIDIAFDDFEDDNNRFDLIWEKIGREEYKSRFQRVKRMDERVGGFWGRTIYLGSRQSERYIRIYDKAAEKRVGFTWIRYELELKGDSARKAWKDIKRAGAVLAGCLAKFSPVEGDNQWRKDRDVCEWWERFVNGGINLKYEKSDVENPLERTREWLSKISRSIFVVVEAYGRAEIERLLEDGYEKQRKRQVYI